MAGWSAEDSNLNTKCHACSKVTVPFLSVHIKVDENLSESKQSDNLSVPYLNPLVLRKELENILSQEGDVSLSSPSFIDEHPIIYWNLVWIMERIDVTTHLPNLRLPREVISWGDEVMQVKQTKISFNVPDWPWKRSTSWIGQNDFRSMFVGQFTTSCWSRSANVHAMETESATQCAAESFTHRSNVTQSNVSVNRASHWPITFCIYSRHSSQCHSTSHHIAALQRSINPSKAASHRTWQIEIARCGSITFHLSRHSISGPNGNRSVQHWYGIFPSGICCRFRQTYRNRMQHLLSQPGSATVIGGYVLSGIF